MKLSHYQGNNSYTFLCFYAVKKYKEQSLAITKSGMMDYGYAENETIL